MKSEVPQRLTIVVGNYSAPLPKKSLSMDGFGRLDEVTTNELSDLPVSGRNATSCILRRICKAICALPGLFDLAAAFMTL